MLLCRISTVPFPNYFFSVLYRIASGNWLSIIGLVTLPIARKTLSIYPVYIYILVSLSLCSRRCGPKSEQRETHERAVSVYVVVYPQLSALIHSVDQRQHQRQSNQKDHIIDLSPILFFFFSFIQYIRKSLKTIVVVEARSIVTEYKDKKRNFIIYIVSAGFFQFSFLYIYEVTIDCR